MHDSWLAQHFVTLNALLLDKLSHSVSNISSMFDEESEMGAWFVEQGVNIGEYRDWFMRASRKVCSKFLTRLNLK